MKMGQIINRTGFLRVSRREIDGNSADGEFQSAVLHGCADPLSGLLHRRIRQSHDVKGRQSAGQIAFNGYLVPANSAQTKGAYV